MRLKRTDYRRWKILILPENSFTCCPPDGDPIAVDRRYESVEMAFAAAKTFVDRMIVREGIREILDDWLEAGKIQADEYDRLNQLIGVLVRSSILNHFEFAQTPPLQSPENLPDSSPESPA